MESMLEISMLDLTRGLTGFPHHLLDPAMLEVEIQMVDVDPDDEAFSESWFRRGDDISDGRIDEPYELSPSEVIALAIA
jgi:hypothetical protein